MEFYRRLFGVYFNVSFQNHFTPTRCLRGGLCAHQLQTLLNDNYWENGHECQTVIYSECHQNVERRAETIAQAIDQYFDASMSVNVSIDTQAKRCFATHDEDIDYFNMRIYIILIACVYIQQFNFVQ